MDFVGQHVKGWLVNEQGGINDIPNYVDVPDFSIRVVLYVIKVLGWHYMPEASWAEASSSASSAFFCRSAYRAGAKTQYIIQ